MVRISVGTQVVDISAILPSNMRTGTEERRITSVAPFTLMVCSDRAFDCGMHGCKVPYTPFR